MENASKALLMAGGVLIGVLVISLAVYLFADFGATSAEINAQNAQKQITAFNSKFTVYQGYEEDITIYDIISLATFVNENNAYYEDSPDDQINVNIGVGKSILNLTAEELIEQYVKDNGELCTFNCGADAISYHDNGRVSSITFTKIK